MRKKMSSGSTSKMRYVDSAMWDSDYFLMNHRDLRITYACAFTNANVNLSGCYKIGIALLSVRVGMTVDELRPILTKLEADEKIIYREGWILVRNFIDHQKLNNPQIRTGIKAIIPTLPQWAIDTVLMDYPELIDDSSGVIDESSHNLNSDSYSDLDLKIQKESLSSPAREFPTENFGKKTGIKASDMIGGESSPLAIVIEGLRERMGYIVALPKEFEWIRSTEAGFKNGFTADHMLEVYDLLEKIRKKKRQRWVIKPDNWETNMPRLEELKEELKELEHGHGIGNENSGGRTSGGEAETNAGSGRRTFKSPEVKRRPTRGTG